MEDMLDYSMKIVARKAGLTPHTIRVWERRYGAIRPARTASNRRRYSRRDLTRLILLGEATRAGHNIGSIAQLPDERLAALVQEERRRAPEPPRAEAVPSQPPESWVEAALSAAQSMDAASLENVLTKASAALSLPVFLQELIAPLMVRMGVHWREGMIRVAHEHMATTVVRTMLGDLLRRAEVPESAPRIVVTTPAGQLHEIGALLVAVTAASEGWNVTCLGPNLPAEEIAGAAAQTSARAVALSIVYPADDGRLPGEIHRLWRQLPEEVALLLGGTSAGNYKANLEGLRLIFVPDLQSLRTELEHLRAGARTGTGPE